MLLHVVLLACPHWYVMKDSKATEFAPPQELLKNEDSLFRDCETLLPRDIPCTYML